MFGCQLLDSLSFSQPSTAHPQRAGMCQSCRPHRDDLQRWSDQDSDLYHSHQTISFYFSLSVLINCFSGSGQPLLPTVYVSDSLQHSSSAYQLSKRVNKWCFTWAQWCLLCFSLQVTCCSHEDAQLSVLFRSKCLPRGAWWWLGLGCGRCLFLCGGLHLWDPQEPGCLPPGSDGGVWGE